MTFTTSYLFLYNFLLTFGWAYVLFLEIKTLFVSQFDLVKTYTAVEAPLKLAQTAAILEIVHSAAGIVRSRVDITAAQVSSRLFLVWGICHLFPQIIGRTYGVPMMIVAWGITEIVRYGYYASNLVNRVPYMLLWLRYTLFYILYPMGVTGELLAIYESVRISYGQILFLRLPNVFNIQFRYDLMMIGVMLSYAIFFPMLFGHMIAQRGKMLRKPHQS